VENRRAPSRTRTKRRGRVNARKEEDGGFPSPPSYDSVTITRSECLTLKNGPRAVSRWPPYPSNSMPPSLSRNSDREKGT